MFLIYEYGFIKTTSGLIKARRNIFTKEVQFLLWSKGEHGHSKDVWHKSGDGHKFIK